MAIAARTGVEVRAFRLRSPSVRADSEPRQRAQLSFRDFPSGCYSNQHRQHSLGIQILDAKWQIHRAFARSAAAGLPAGGP